MTIRPLLLALALLILTLSPSIGQDWQAIDEANVRGDYAKAMELLRPSAEQGDADAQFSLGGMYGMGAGVPQDHAEAARWLRRAAERGHSTAQFNLGGMYDEGRGVPQDPAEAAHWLTKAAGRGNDRAQYNLGIMYYEGKGVPQDYVPAYAWLNLAAVSGDEKTKKAKETLRKLMIAEQIARAQEMSTNLFNRINAAPAK